MAGKTTLFFTIFMAVLIGGGLLLGGLFMFSNLQQTLPSEAGRIDGEVKAETEKKAGGFSAFCSNNPAVDLNIRCQNTEDSTAVSYINCSLAVANTVTNSIITRTIDDTTGAWDVFTNELRCGEPYEITVLSTAGKTNGGWEISLSAEDTMKDPVYVDAKASYFNTTRVRIYSVDDKVYFYNDGATGASNRDGKQGTWMNLAGSSSTALVNFTSTTANSTLTTVGADGTLHYVIEAKTEAADRLAGTRTWIGFDYLGDTSDTDDWQNPTVEITGGIPTEFRGVRTNIKAELKANDILALGGYEYIIDTVKPFHENEMYVDVIFRSGDGINPDRNLNHRVIATGLYSDEDKINNIIGRTKTESHGIGFRTDSSRTALHNVDQYFSIDIV